MLDVAVNAHGAAVHDAPGARAFAASTIWPTATAFTARYSEPRQAGLAVERGDVVDDLDALERATQTVRVGEVAHLRRGADLRERRRVSASAHERADVVAGPPASAARDDRR